MVGIRSPDGLVVGSCTSHPGVLGSIPKREEPGKTGRHPVLKYRVPQGVPLVRDGQTSPHRPRLVVSRSTRFGTGLTAGPEIQGQPAQTKISAGPGRPGVCVGCLFFFTIVRTVVINVFFKD
jgi:hypothetical protein